MTIDAIIRRPVAGRSARDGIRRLARLALESLVANNDRTS